ncbi:hypothetical protein HZA41_02485 [Candidatus Peregrinibacteria bacterium]|nr:hypothetical protein [Candidatus Peregrinibacteria bacterium]
MPTSTPTPIATATATARPTPSIDPTPDVSSDPSRISETSDEKTAPGCGGGCNEMPKNTPANSGNPLGAALPLLVGLPWALKRRQKLLVEELIANADLDQRQDGHRYEIPW